MIIVDESDPVGEIVASFEPRNVTVKKGVDAKEFYDLLTEIGRGKFGTVYKCQEKSTGLKLACKMVPIPKRDDRRNVEREVEIMNSLQHPLIIQLYDAYEYSKMMCVVLELIEGGELFDRVIDDEFVLTEKTCTVLVRQLCQAMEFVHSNNILHLDLKPENILCLTRDGNRIKVIDFGLARRYDPDKKLQVLFGTPEFVAPEVVNFDIISFATDMWSVGVICYVLLSGLSPFMGSTDIETMTNVTIGKYDFDDEAFQKVSKESLDFISKLLVKDPSVRMTAEQCLEHSWLKQYPKKPEIIETQSECITNGDIKSPVIEVEANEPENELQLTSTKENLKSFIERWEEHPNSPYIFDANSSLILPTVKDAEKNTSSGFSSRGCSPSPCESLSSNTELFENGISPESEVPPELDNDFEPPDAVDNKPQKELFERPSSSASADRNSKSKQEYLQSFDRRHSDSNYVMNHTSGIERLNLAEEIKKLSDRLLVLSSLNDELKEFNKRIEESRTKTTTKTTTPSTADKIVHAKRTEVMKNLKNATSFSSSTKTEKVIVSKMIHSKSLMSDDEATSSSRFATKSVVNDLTERLRSLDETPSMFKKVVNASTKTTNETISTSLGNRLKAITTSTSNSSSESTSPCTFGSVPWPITNRRTKFRVTQLSRDVPVGSPDSHQTIFLEEAANTTKDCLLQLLDKYNAKGARTCNIRRHQSIAVGNGITDNLEYNSMNSINAFFKRNAFQQNGNTVRKIKARIESKHL
ncbi:calcium/calmodulin-dependent protein kinase type IV isoform X2 [Sitodiplosis mosellana]|uniref:calcium/calmodulin-dependent protein kinase type IV isoform X2 n=1 Tax=Sitodiplosis mosellana TaxID=263140 RepID=UPI002444DAE2|nr:calcium/calmodulin-dependent protein kinase type IV isoform X2 [Sitodiplosis mosellana]XP_055312742.1 calcium/calmodulin-dependent protein kinase type IV isoform X2 [Sitodiplosis mosellana]